MNRADAKTVLRRLGLYPIVRHWYRRIHPALRQERAQERHFYRQFVRDGDLCFDVGANVGQTTEALLACKARVIAVEPNPACVRALNWEFGAHRDVTIVEQAIGGAIGFADLHFEGTNATGSLRPDWPFPAHETRRVPLTTLDELIARFGRPRLCKIDVEGYEREVFQGLSQPIPIIRFEFHGGELPRTIDCLAHLERIGGAGTANATDADGTAFVSDHFLNFADIIELIRSRGMRRGNLLVKMDA